MYLWIMISSALVIIDQLFKLFVTASFEFYDSFTFIPYILDIVYVKNTGAAFSIFENHTWILGLVSAIFSVAIVVYMLKAKPKDKITIISAGLLLGGAIGNGIDRIFRGYVVDFIEFSFINFPVFNIADIAITLGACLLILGILLDERKNRSKEEI